MEAIGLPRRSRSDTPSSPPINELTRTFRQCGQVVLAIGTGLAIMAVEWQSFFLIGFAAAAIVMLVLSTTAVRRALGKE